MARWPSLYLPNMVENIPPSSDMRVMTPPLAAINDANTPLPPEDYLPGTFFTKGPLGVYWLNAGQRGEGLNLVDYAAAVYGPSFTIETGMKRSFAERVATSKLAAQKAVEVFEERHIQ